MPRAAPLLSAIALIMSSTIARAQTDRGVAPDPDTLARTFASAPPEFGPVPIWWWSGERLDRERLFWQLEQFAHGHIFNVIVLNLAPSGPLFGSDADDPAFFSEEWWALFESVVGRARELGIRIWFYDQIGFSGASIQARLVTEHPEYQARALRMERIDASAAGPLEWKLPPGAQFLAAHAAWRSDEVAVQSPHWIWLPGAQSQHGRAYFRRSVTLDEPPHQAWISLTADNGYRLFINGAEMGADSGYSESHWQRAERFDIASHLRAGENTIAIEAENMGGPAGLLVETIVVPEEDAGFFSIDSDQQWLVTDAPEEGWRDADFVPGKGWFQPEIIGSHGIAPWGLVAGIRPVHQPPPFETIQHLFRLQPDEDGVIRWRAPDGKATLLISYTVPGGFDYLNPSAGAALLDTIHGEFERRLGEHLGSTIAGSFQDELPAIPHWSAHVPAEFEERKGYSIIEHLPALFFDMDDRHADSFELLQMRVRTDLYEVLTDLAEESFFKPAFDWHEKHGMICGYDQVARSGDPIHATQWYLDYFETHRWYGAPGNDMDGRTRPHSSIANIYDRPRVWLEGFHSSGWGQTIEDVAHLLHAFYREGATLYNPHAIYYATRGGWWEWAPPDTGFRQPYWKDYHHFADYVARLSYILSQGTHVADAAVLYPARTVQADLAGGQPGPDAARVRDEFWAIVDALDAAGRDFDVIDEASIARAEVTEQGLKVGNETYPALIVPSTTTIGADAFEKTLEFNNPRVPLIFLDPTNLRGPHDPKAVFRGVNTPEAAVAALGDALPKDVEGPVQSLHRKIGDLDVYFLVPDLETRADSGSRFEIAKRDLHEWSEGMRKLTLSFRVQGAPELWNALTGEIEPIHEWRRIGERTEVVMPFEHAPAALVVFRPHDDSNRPQVLSSTLEQIESIERRGDGSLSITGFVKGDGGSPRIELMWDDERFVAQGDAPALPPARDLGNTFTSEIIPTFDNRWGDYAWPPSAGPLPVEARRVQYRLTGEGDDPWRDATLTFGPKAMVAGPFTVEVVEELLRDAVRFEGITEWRPVRWSDTHGIEEDPMHRGSLGPKGHVPEEFIDVGTIPAGQTVIVRSFLYFHGSGPVPLHFASRAGISVRFNGRIIEQGGLIAPQSDRNELVIALTAPPDRSASSRTFVFATEQPLRDPRPMWIGAPSEHQDSFFRAQTTWKLPAKPQAARIAIAYDAPVRIIVNGALAADLGRYDAYFMSRSQHVDLTAFLHEGDNEIIVEMERPWRDAAFLVDGEAVFETGPDSWLTSSGDWSVQAGEGENAPARELAGPVHNFMGDTASLSLRRRAHPLRSAGWLEDRVLPPLDDVIPVWWYPTLTDERTPEYRLRVPSGATEVHLEIAGEFMEFAARLSGEAIEFDSHDRASLPHPEQAERWLTIRGANWGDIEGAGFTAPISFELGRGIIHLGGWREQGLADYSGAVVYEATFNEAPEADSTILSLGRVRGTAEVTVNGRSAGVRLWHPYEFEVGQLLHADRPNIIRITITNTLGPHYDALNPSHYVFEGQSVSGLFGPVELIPRARIILTATPSGD